MADISALFDDALFPVEIENPRTKKPIGVTMYIAPFEADATVDWFIRSQAQMAHIKNAGPPDADTIADIDARAMVLRAIRAVRKWDWHGNSFGDLGKDPECTDENKRKVIGDPRFSWIADQIFLAGVKAENFTPKPEAD